MYTDTAMPGRRSARGSARPDRLGVSSMNTPYGSMERTTPRTVSPTENSAAFCAQVPSSSRWVSEILRFSGSTVRTAARMDCPTVNRSPGWQMRDTDIFSMPMSDGTPQPASTNAPNGSRCVTRAGITSPGRRESSSRSCAFCWTMVRDSHAVGGSVLSSISVTTKQVGLPTRDRMAISRVSPSATPSAQDTRGRMPCAMPRSNSRSCAAVHRCATASRMRPSSCACRSAPSVENACRTAGCTM